MDQVRADREHGCERIGQMLTAWRKARSGASTGQAALPEAGGPLPAEQQRRFAPILGRDLSKVTLSRSTESAAAADQLEARAFTVGSHIHMGHGEPLPGTRDGDRLLAHELRHAVDDKPTTVSRDARPGAGPAATPAGVTASHPGDSSEAAADATADHAESALHGQAPAPSNPAPDGAAAADADAEAHAAAARQEAQQVMTAEQDGQTPAWSTNPDERARMARLFPYRGRMTRMAVGLLRTAAFWRLSPEARWTRTWEVLQNRIAELAHDPRANDRREIADTPIGSTAEEGRPAAGAAPELRGSALTRARGARDHERAGLVSTMHTLNPSTPPHDPRVLRRLTNAAAQQIQNDVNLSVDEAEAELGRLMTQLGIPPEDWRARTARGALGLPYASAHGNYARPQDLLVVLFRHFAPGANAHPPPHNAQTALGYFARMPLGEAVPLLQSLRSGGTLAAPPQPTTGSRPPPRQLSAAVPRMDDDVWAHIERLAQLGARTGTAEHRHSNDTGDLPAPWGAIISEWRDGQTTNWRGAVENRPDEIQLSSEVCNELSEHAQARRGNQLSGGIRGDAVDFENEAAQPASEEDAAGQAPFFRAGSQMRDRDFIPGATVFLAVGHWMTERPAGWTAVVIPDNVPLPELADPPAPAAAARPATARPAGNAPTPPTAAAGAAPPGGPPWNRPERGPDGVSRSRTLPDGTIERQYMWWAHELTIFLNQPEMGGALVIETTDQSTRGGGEAPSSGVTLRPYGFLRQSTAMVGYSPENRIRRPPPRRRGH
jgi:hypothetical protein